MSHAEFVQWQAYAALDPFGSVRGDMHAALVASTMANVSLGGKQRQSFKLQDFLLNFTPKRRITTAEGQKEFFRQMTLAVGGQVISKKAA